MAKKKNNRNLPPWNLEEFNLPTGELMEFVVHFVFSYTQKSIFLMFFIVERKTQTYMTLCEKVIVKHLNITFLSHLSYVPLATHWPDLR